MTVDASIPLQVRPFQMEDPLTAASKALQMQQAVNSSRLANLQIRSLSGQLDREDKLRSLLPGATDASGNVDSDKLASVYVQAGMPEKAMEAKQTGLTTAKAQLDLSNTQLAMHDAAHGRLASYLNGAKDPQTYNAAIQAGLQDENPLVVQATQQFAKSNPEFNPQAIEAAKNRMLAYKDQLDAEMKNRGLTLQENAQTEAQRHNKATEQVAALGVDPNNKAAIAGAEQRAKMAAAGGAVDPATVEHWAQVVSKGGQLPPGLARGDAGKALILGVVNRAAQLGTPSDYLANIAQQAGIRAGQTALGERQANMGMAQQEIVAPGALADVAIKASQAVPRGKWVPVNTALQALDRGESDPQLKAFATANLGLATAYSVAMSRGGVPSDSARNEALRILSTATGPQAYEAAVNQIRAEVEAANRAPAAVREELRTAGGATPNPQQPNQPPAVLPPVNAKGWQLHEDANGNKAYVGPKGEVEEVR